MPRALIFAVTRHSLRDAWAKGKRSGQFDSKEIVSGLGRPSQSWAEGRAALKDSLGLLDEARTKLGELNKEFRALSRNLEDDKERFEAETEISRMLSEIENENIKINVLKEHLRRSHGK